MCDDKITAVQRSVILVCSTSTAVFTYFVLWHIVDVVDLLEQILEKL